MTKIVLEPYICPIDETIYRVCGADEAGRGPLMGNVVAACVLLDPNNPIEGLYEYLKRLPRGYETCLYQYGL